MAKPIVSLLDGNRTHADAFADRFDDLQDAQHPDAVSVCCSDSRVLQDALLGNDEPGRVFTVGNIGNRVVQRTDDGETVVSGDVVYPLAYTGTETAVVVGHTGCGAVTATYDAIRAERGDADDDPVPASEHPPGVERCIDLLRPRIEPGVDELPEGLDHADAVNHLVEYNVDRQVDALTESADVPDGVDAYGVVYDFQDVYSGDRGEVHVVNVDGKRDPDRIRDANPEIAERVTRRFAY
ncbi:IcfA [Halorubellus sp. JP-L1]|uniref:carbonic anhydrase n=1 Tax=Halorubellus sp. JP-L1 TaxID=2715753 RepID=UPI0014093DC6|nr:carbonic anhydrase [Halorubellus sp. JP-L1]NHN41059.1 IcfA [Halorubellus sp. JP-L1]